MRKKFPMHFIFQFTASYEADPAETTHEIKLVTFQFTASYEADRLFMNCSFPCFVFQFTASYEADRPPFLLISIQAPFNSQPHTRLT